MDKLLTIFKVHELRSKTLFRAVVLAILFAAVLLAIYGIGFSLPLPIVDQGQLNRSPNS